MAQMTDERFAAIVANLVRDADKYRTERSLSRIKAIEYYDGTMKDVPTEDKKSKVVSRDVRATVKKIMPSVVRTILGNDRVAEYSPLGPDDSGGAEQATDYVNHFVFPESDGYRAVKDAVFDALICKNGVIKWWYDEKTRVTASTHTGLDQMSFEQLVSAEDVEVLEHTERQEVVQTPEGDIPQPVHDVKIKRKIKDGQIRLAAVAPEDFLIHPDALSFDEAPLIGENTRIRRSDLIAMGVDRKRVEEFSVAGQGQLEGDVEKQTRRDITVKDRQAEETAMQEVDYYELFVRVDYDNDGIAELRRVCLAGGLGEENILDNDYADEICYADIICEARPHQWEGQSVAEDVMEMQRIKTVLLRQTMDNLYWQNMPQPIVQEGVVVNPDSVLSPSFGKPIRVNQGVNVAEALGYNRVPFVAKESFAMLEYLDNEITDRTGISDASSGMAPDALQNMTAKASAMIEQAGIGQTELMVRTIAEGLKRVFKGILRLVVKHQDKPRTVRMRNEWVTFDPRQWNADLDVMVNTGLGAGTRERDMMVMAQIIGLQEKINATMGPDNPFVKADNVYNSITKMVEAAGIRAVDNYFTKPDPREVEGKLQAMRNKPDPEIMKLQAQMQLEQQKAIAARDKEQAQMQADIAVKQAELEKNAAAARDQAQSDIAKEQLRYEFEREKLEQAERLELFKLQQQRDIELMKIQASSAMAASPQNQQMTNEVILESIANLSSLIQQMAQPPHEAMEPSKDD